MISENSFSSNDFYNSQEDIENLKRCITVLFFLLLSAEVSAVHNNFIQSIQESLESAQKNYPSRWNYEESAGALGIFQYKNHTCRLSRTNNLNSYTATVISSSEDHEKANATDPRTPIKSGDTFNFSLNSLLTPFNPFRAVTSSLNIQDIGIQHEGEYAYQEFSIKYAAIDPDTGNQVRMEGVIFLTPETGNLKKMTIRQIDIGKKEKEKYWHIYFERCSEGSVSCRLKKIEHVNIGKFLFFNYVFNSSTQYEY